MDIIEIKQILPLLHTGCTFRYAPNYGREEERICTMRDSSYARIPMVNPSWDLLYHLKTYPKKAEYIFGFYYPDGTPMLPEGEESSPVIRKVKSLQLRFKTKKLPKTRLEKLPLP